MCGVLARQWKDIILQDLATHRGWCCSTAFTLIEVLSSKRTDFIHVEQSPNLTACMSLNPSPRHPMPAAAQSMPGVPSAERQNSTNFYSLWKEIICHCLLNSQPEDNAESSSPLMKNAKPLNVPLEGAVEHTARSRMPRCTLPLGARLIKSTNSFHLLWSDLACPTLKWLQTSEFFSFIPR